MLSLVIGPTNTSNLSIGILKVYTEKSIKLIQQVRLDRSLEIVFTKKKAKLFLQKDSGSQIDLTAFVTLFAHTMSNRSTEDNTYKVSRTH